MNRNTQVQMLAPLTPVVKRLLIVNSVIWIVAILVVQKYFLSEQYFFDWFGLVPARLISDFWIWQPFSYMFLHQYSVFHIVFNMLMLWFLGAELEQRWGGRFFFIYYMVCGVGAGILYTIGLVIYYLASGNPGPLAAPVIGASGAVFGLFLAYGMIFGERVIYFMMLFPMRAKYFVMILAGIEVLTLLNSGFSSNVANLAHLGGLVVGFLFLIFWARYKGRRVRTKTRKHGRKLKLVVDNEREEETDGPKYWN